MRIIKVTLSLVLGFVLVAILIAAFPAAANIDAVTSDLITEYPIPGSPQNIIVESPGHVWFTLPLSNAIGSLIVTSTVDYKVTLYEATVDSQPYDLALDGDAIWFTEKAGNRLGRLSLTTMLITETALISTTNVAPMGISVGMDGKVWFTEQDVNALGLFEPGNGFSELFPNSQATSNGKFDDIVVGSNGLVWLTAPGWNSIYRYDENQSSNGGFTLIQVGDFLETWAPGGIVVDNGQVPWVAAPSKDFIGRYVAGTLAFWNWRILPDSGGDPTGLAYSYSDGAHNLWYTEPSTGYVGRYVADSNIKTVFAQERPLPTPNSMPTGIAVDANGHVWIAESGSNQIAEWQPPYFNFVYLPVVIK